jgi:hypothetical protein
MSGAATVDTIRHDLTAELSHLEIIVARAMRVKRILQCAGFETDAMRLLTYQ